MRKRTIIVALTVLAFLLPGLQARAGEWVPHKYLRAEASSVLKPSKVATYIPENVIDGNTSTCWVEGVPGYGVNEWIEVKLPKVMKVSKVSILNGYNKPGGSFHKNSRVKKASILLSDDNTTYNIVLKDSQKFQTFSFPPILTDGVMIFIGSVYPGTKWKDTCISEIRVYVED